MIPSSNNQFYNAYDPQTREDLYNYQPGSKEINQYYDIEQGKTAAQLANEIATRGTGYNIGASELQNQLGVDTRALNNMEGEKGTWGSSARNIRLGSLGTTYGNKFADLYNTTQGANTQSLIGGEYNLGASNLPQSNLQGYSVNLSGSQPGAGAMGATTAPSQQAKYNPFGGYGDINRQRKQTLYGQSGFKTNKVNYNPYIQN